MNRLLLLFLIVAGLVSAVFAQRSDVIKAVIYAPPKPSEFREFIAPDKSFSIVFAGEPESNLDDSAPRGTIINYSVENAASESAVTILDFEYVIDDPEFVYKLMRGDPGSSRKLVAEREAKSDGVSAREFEVEHFGSLEVTRVLIVGNRVYQLRSKVSNWQFLSKRFPAKIAEFRAETARFFGSFAVLKKPAPGRKPLPDEFLGAVNDGVYDNPYFGFRLKLPDGWTQLEQEAIDSGKKTGIELLKTDEESFDRKLETSAQKEVIIFGAGNRRPGQTTGGSVLLISAFRQPKGPITSGDVINTSVRFLGANPKLSFGEVKSMTRGGVRMSYVDFRTSLGGVVIKQRMIIVMRNGFSVTMVVACNNDSEFKELETMIDGIEFE